MTRRLVSIRGNSGESWHLPPKVAIDLMDAEVTDNDMIAKLVAQGVIGLQGSHLRKAWNLLPKRKKEVDGHDPSVKGSNNTEKRSVLWRN